MNSKSLVLLLMYIVNLSSALYAQDKFESGYYINTQNDTISGYFLIGNKFSINKSIKYVQTDDSKNELSIDNSEIESIVLDSGRYFIVKNLSLNGDNSKVILEFLLEGIVNIFRYKPGLKEIYFLEDEDGRIVELSNVQRKVYLDDGKEKYMNSNKYIKNLSYAFKDDPKSSEYLSTLKFSPEAIIKVSQKYHENMCDDECIIYKKERQESRINYTISFAVQSSEYSLTGAAVYYDFVDHMENSTFEIGIGMNYLNPNLSNNLEFRTKVSFAPINTSENSSISYRSVEYKTTQVSKAIKVDFEIAPTYFLNLGSIPIDLGIGIGMSYNFFEDRKIYVQDFDYYKEENLETPMASLFWSLSPMIGQSYTINDRHGIFWNVAYKYSVGMYNVSSPTKVKSLIFILGYKF